MPTNPTPRETLEQELKKVAIDATTITVGPHGESIIGTITLEESRRRLLAAADRYAEAKVREVPSSKYTMADVMDNASIGWFTRGGIVFQITEMGKSARVVGLLTTPADQTSKEVK